MKRRFIILLLLAVAAISTEAQIGIGMRDTRFVNISYLYKKHYGVKLEHSVFAEKIPFQYIRGYLSYHTAINKFGVGVSPYFGTTWNGFFYNLGAQVNADYSFTTKFNVFGTLNPHYDSAYGYKTYARAGAWYMIWEHLGVIADFTTMPEYRTSQNRVEGGARFIYSNFMFTPMVSVPVGGNENFRSVRVNVGFSYRF